MNGKKMLFFAIVLAALGALYFSSEQRAAKKGRKIELPLTAGFDASRAAAITITAPGKAAVVLKKHGGSWYITAGDRTFGADTAAVNSLLDQIGTLKSATVASRNPKNFESFDISDGKAVAVKIEDAGQKVSAHVLLGKNGPDIFSTYVRAKDAGTVYLVPGILKNTADREIKDWREKKIWRLNADRIAQYTVAGDRNLQLKKDAAGSWQAVCDGKAFSAGKSAVTKALQSFAALKAADFIDGSPKEAGLDKPLRTITAVLDNGTREVLFVGADKNAFQHYVKPGSQQQVFIVEKSETETISPSCEGLKEGASSADNATAKAAYPGKQ
ncbi:MAG: DUF4340 domain-containing protein [Deltaproteobacteria bacterium]|nr:DUF4340 domain-containing protein [Deltaproteobacteria bacterium]